MKKPKSEYLADAIAAVKLLRQNKTAFSSGERAVLLSFPGGGILKECGVFTDAQNPAWLATGRDELRSLLTDEEWVAVQNSGLQNAHYTSQAIRQCIWEAVAPFIKEGDYVLDPGCGIGGFAVDMPAHLNLRYVGVEKDCLSAALAKAIHPQAQIYNRDFMQFRYPLRFQLVIGNIPFTNGVNSMQVGLDKLRVAIHAQFFVESINHLAPGGLLALLTTTSTLDSRGEDYIKFRRWVDSKCDFLGAVRLPCSGIHYGDTEVTTDLVLLKKAGERRQEAGGSWFSVGQSSITDWNDDPIHLSQWYLDNPQYLLGEPTFAQLRGRNGNPAPTLALTPKPGQDVLADFRLALSSILEKAGGRRQEAGGLSSSSILNSTKFCSFELGDISNVKLWSLEKYENPKFNYDLYVFAIRGGRIGIWQTHRPGTWFAVDKHERNIKTHRDAFGQQTFEGNDPQEVAFKAYNWLMSKTAREDYIDVHPWVGLDVIGLCIHTNQITKGKITTVNPDGEIVEHICIGDAICQKWLIFAGDTEIASLYNDDNFTNQINEDTTMATVIPADKFESDAVWAFILRENPQQKGIEIHFPPESEVKSSDETQFISRITNAGFQISKTNPKLYYTPYTPDLMTKCRSWVKACEKFGAYEIPYDVPVEKTRSRYRKKSAPTTKPDAPTSTPSATPNKLVEALLEAITPTLGELPNQVAIAVVEQLKLAYTDSQSQADLEKLRQEHQQLQAHCQGLEHKLSGVASSFTSLKIDYEQCVKERDAAIKDLEQAKQDYVNLKQTFDQTCEQLTTLQKLNQEFGISEFVAPSSPDFDAAPVFGDDAVDSIFGEEVVQEVAPTFDDGEIQDTLTSFPDESTDGFDLDALDSSK